MTRPTPAATRAPTAKTAPAAAAQVLQPGTRVCRWPGRDLLTGALLSPDADVHVVSEEEWYGPRGQQAQQSQAALGPTLSPGLARELKDWPARRAAIVAAAERAADERAGDADDADDADDREASA